MKVAIIGAGPIGLYFAGLCEQRNIDYAIFERMNKKSKNGKYILNCGNDKSKNYRLRKEDN